MEAAEPLGVKIQEDLLAIPKFGKGIGLHRMLALCRTLLQTDWLSNLDAIKITGSNGKGSVCAMVAAVFGELSISCGLYTSPHLIKFNERIVTNGEPIADAELAEAVAWFIQQRDEYASRFPDDTIGAFEAFTAIALHHFAGKRPRVLVSEAGIGGRYDSTRIIPGKIVGLTSLDLEHTGLLGSTLEMIAYDKADLCPPGGVIIAGAIDADVLRRLQAYCTLRNVTLRAAAAHSQVRRVVFGDTHMEVDLTIDGVDLPALQMAVQGYHQITNLVVATLLVRQWLQAHEPRISPEQLTHALRCAMRSLSWPGRFERIATNPDIFIDVGHTPEAIAATVRTAQTALRGKRILLVTGVSYDKDVEGIVKGLLPMADAVICTRAHHKGSPPEKILRIVQRARPELAASLAPTIEEAMRMARAQAVENQMTVMVAGGLFLSIEAVEALRGNDPRSLHFF
ncbi:MAG: dihydrofolate synthase / folylpolyglutamate synthase [Blastocatellia bacterium]